MWFKVYSQLICFSFGICFSQLHSIPLFPQKANANANAKANYTYKLSTINFIKANANAKANAFIYIFLTFVARVLERRLHRSAGNRFPPNSKKKTCAHSGTAVISTLTTCSIWDILKVYSFKGQTAAVPGNAL